MKNLMVLGVLASALITTVAFADENTTQTQTFATSQAANPTDPNATTDNTQQVTQSTADATDSSTVKTPATNG